MATYTFDQAVKDAGAYYRNLVAGGESEASAAAQADGLLQELLREMGRAKAGHQTPRQLTQTGGATC